MIRTDGGSSGLASMRLVVLSDKRSSLCFVLMIVQAVLLWTPSAFACLSNATHPSATKRRQCAEFWSRICGTREVPNVQHSGLEQVPDESGQSKIFGQFLQL